MNNPWFFICDSDQHFTCASGDEDNYTTRKGDYFAKFATLKNIYNPELLLCPGDCTDHGADNLFNCFCQKESKFGDEVQVFINQWVNKIERLGIRVMVSPGNHDVNKSKYPNLALLKYVRDRYHATYNWFVTKNSGCYTFVHNGILFISMGVYPTNLSWLKKNLPSDKNIPIVFFYHYNIESDWWTDAEKTAFYETIKEHNVKLIINGHAHVTRKSVWNNIPTIICADDSVVVEVINNQFIIH